MIFEAEKVSTQIKDRSDWDISEWLEKNKVTELPLGFTNFKDGNIPLDRKQIVKPESERNAKIERVNKEARQSKASQARQKEAERIKRQKTIEARKIEREIAKLNRDATKKEQAAIKAELKALGRTQAQIDRADRIKRQVPLLKDFRSKAQMGDMQAMSTMLGFKKDIISKLSSGGVALSAKRLALLEEILPTFQYGTHMDRTKVVAKEISPKRAIWVRNHEAKNAALAKGHREFVGFCHKENKETIFNIYTTRNVSACASCAKALQKKKRKLITKKPREVSENRKRMLKAQAENLKAFTGVCKHHGETPFRIHDVSSFKCKACSAEAMHKTRIKTRAALENNPRTLDVRGFLKRDEKNGRVSALARFLGVSVTTVSNYGLGNAAVTSAHYEKFLEFKKLMSGGAA
ncbi:MAG: hypothetical protein RR605_01775 [Acinetobacter sp.]